MQGITIGSETIIGLGSVVTRDIEDGVIATGNPCAARAKNRLKRVFYKINKV